MAYIRCTSNFQGYYIWDDGKFVHIIDNGTVHNVELPTKIFNGLLRKYYKKYNDIPCKYKGLKLKDGFPGHPVDIRLKYKNEWELFFDSATWDYIVLSFFDIRYIRNFKILKHYYKKFKK
jgi:hypothetical protein